eukprot:2051844-Rhodomonas_salina.2
MKLRSRLQPLDEPRAKSLVRVQRHTLGISSDARDQALVVLDESLCRACLLGLLVVPLDHVALGKVVGDERLEELHELGPRRR